jgi:hypothetical protein
LVFVLNEYIAMLISNPSLPSIPDGLHVDALTLDVSGLLITGHLAPSQGAAERATARMAEARPYTVEETAGGCQVIRLRPSATRRFSRL